MLAPVEEAAGDLWPQGARWQIVNDSYYDWRIVRYGQDDRPLMAMIHGTGASAHSFGYLAAELSHEVNLLAFDLPGHGETRARHTPDHSLPGTAGAVARLFGFLDVAPDYIVAHSAGTAIALQMCQSNGLSPGHVFGINSALEPISGNALLSPIARLLSVSPFTASFFAWQARHGGVENLLRQTGSKLSAEDIAAYKGLFADKGHIRATITMMANWDLAELQAGLDRITSPATLIAAANDPMVPSRVSKRSAARMPASEYVELRAGGHLVHEEDPCEIAEIITSRVNGDRGG